MGLYSGLVEDLRLNVRFLVLHLILGIVSLFVSFNFGINIVDALITIGIISFLEFLGILISIIAMLLMTTGTTQPDPVLLNIVFPSINRKVSDAISIALSLFLMISAIQWWLPVNKEIAGEGGISLSSPPDILVLEVSFGVIIAGMGIALITGALFKYIKIGCAVSKRTVIIAISLIVTGVVFSFFPGMPQASLIDVISVTVLLSLVSMYIFVHRHEARLVARMGNSSNDHAYRGHIVARKLNFMAGFGGMTLLVPFLFVVLYGLDGPRAMIEHIYSSPGAAIILIFLIISGPGTWTTAVQVAFENSRKFCIGILLGVMFLYLTATLFTPLIQALLNSSPDVIVRLLYVLKYEVAALLILVSMFLHPRISTTADLTKTVSLFFSVLTITSMLFLSLTEILSPSMAKDLTFLISIIIVIIIIFIIAPKSAFEAKGHFYLLNDISAIPFILSEERWTAFRRKYQTKHRFLLAPPSNIHIGKNDVIICDELTAERILGKKPRWKPGKWQKIKKFFVVGFAVAKSYAYKFAENSYDSVEPGISAPRNHRKNYLLHVTRDTTKQLVHHAYFWEIYLYAKRAEKIRWILNFPPYWHLIKEIRKNPLDKVEFNIRYYIIAGHSLVKNSGNDLVSMINECIKNTTTSLNDSLSSDDAEIKYYDTIGKLVAYINSINRENAEDPALFIPISLDELVFALREVRWYKISELPA